MKTIKEETVSRFVNVLEEDIEEVLFGSCYFKFPECILHVMSLSEAMMVVFLVNHKREVKALRKNGGWFYCSSSKMSEHILFSPKKQTRTIASLRKKGFIRLEMRGVPAKRWMWLETPFIFKCIQEKLEVFRAKQEKIKEARRLERGRKGREYWAQNYEEDDD